MGDIGKREVLLYALRYTGVSPSANATGKAKPLQLTTEGYLQVAGNNFLLDPENNAEVQEKSNYRQSLFTEVSRTASANSAWITNYTFKGGHLVINVVDLTATPSVVPVIEAQDYFDPTVYYEVLRGNAITTTGINVLKIYPGITPVPNISANDILPTVFRLTMEHADTDAITYTAYIAMTR